MKKPTSNQPPADNALKAAPISQSPEDGKSAAPAANSSDAPPRSPEGTPPAKRVTTEPANAAPISRTPDDGKTAVPAATSSDPSPRSPEGTPGPASINGEPVTAEPVNAAPVNLPVLPQSGALRATDMVEPPAQAPEAAPGEELRSFVVQSRVKHDGKRYGPRAIITIDRLTHARLKADKAIIGGWHDGLPADEPLLLSDEERARRPRLDRDATDDPSQRNTAYPRR